MLPKKWFHDVDKAASKGLTHLTFLFSLFRNGKKRWAKMLSKCNMKALCDVGVCYIVKKVYKRPFYIAAY